jgi:FdhD protein
MNPEVQEVDVLRVGADSGLPVCDVAAAEEPLELRLGGERFVVIMRTPGADRELATGFLLSEQIVRSASDVSAMRYCTDQDGRDSANVLSVWLNGDAALRAHQAMSGRRHVTSNSSCGVCGKGALEAVAVEAPRVTSDVEVPFAVVARLPALLLNAQSAFALTGGLHATGLFSATGELECLREDVGRHNAMDKVVGWALREHRLPLERSLLCVSGRLSFELVQKAVVAGCPILVAVGAPSTLAVSLAEDRGVTLCGFVRDGRATVYTEPHRIGK